MSAPRPIRELVAAVWSWDLYWEYMRVGLTAIPAGIAWAWLEMHGHDRWYYLLPLLAGTLGLHFWLKSRYWSGERKTP